MLNHKKTLALYLTTMALACATQKAFCDAVTVDSKSNYFSFVSAGDCIFLRYHRTNIFAIVGKNEANRNEFVLGDTDMYAEYSVMYVSNSISDVIMTPRSSNKISYSMTPIGLSTAQWEKMVEFPELNKPAMVFTLDYQKAASLPKLTTEKLDLAYIHTLEKHGQSHKSILGDMEVTVWSDNISNCVVTINGKQCFAMKYAGKKLAEYTVFTNGIPHYSFVQNFNQIIKQPSSYTLYGGGDKGILPVMTYVDNNEDGYIDIYFSHITGESGRITYHIWEGPKESLRPEANIFDATESIIHLNHKQNKNNDESP